MLCLVHTAGGLPIHERMGKQKLLHFEEYKKMNIQKLQAADWLVPLPAWNSWAQIYHGNWEGRVLHSATDLAHLFDLTSFSFFDYSWESELLHLSETPNKL